MLGIGKISVSLSVKARLTENGKALKNVKVRREWDWNKPEFDESVTDEDGIVTFPAVYESSISRMLAVEIAISQRL